MSTGFDHVATVTADLDRIVVFYETVFDARVTLEMAATDDHPRLAILDLGGGSALNVAEQPAASIVGDRRTPGARGPVDHYGIGVASRAELEEVRDRLAAAGADLGEIQRLGDTWSLFFRDPDGMELEVCTPAEDTTADDTDSTLRQLVDALQDAQFAVEPFLKLHTADAVIVNFGGRRVLGRDDLRQAMESALASPLAKVTTSAEIHDVRRVRPDVAIISCTKHVTDDRDTAGTLATKGSLTYVAVRDEGEWRIALAQTTPIAGT